MRVFKLVFLIIVICSSKNLFSQVPNKDSINYKKFIEDSTKAYKLTIDIKESSEKLKMISNNVNESKNNVQQREVKKKELDTLLKKLLKNNEDLKMVNASLLEYSKQLKASALKDSVEAANQFAKNKLIKEENVRDSIKNDSISKVNKSLDTSVKNQKSILDSVRVVLEKIKDTMVVIAEIDLANTKLNIYKSTSKKEKQNCNDPNVIINSCTIKEVKIRIKEGLILYINVYTDKGVFRNKRSPIGLTLVNEKRINDRLFIDGFESNEYLILSDVIKYTPRRNYNYIPYADIEFSLNKKDSFYLIKENTNINFYVDVAAFTDVKGISGDANGLAQIFMAGKFITSTKNILNTAIIPFNFISAEGFVAKFDNSFKGTNVDTISNIVDRTKLFQTSYYRIGVKANLVHWVLSPFPKRLIEDIQINFGYNFNGARTQRIVNKGSIANPILDTVFTPIIQNQWYIEPIFRFTRNSNFGFSLSIPVVWQSVKASAGVYNKETIVYANPTISLSYYSPKSPGNTIFFRYSNFIDLKNPENAFTQAQLGYSVNFTDMFKLSK